MLTLTATNLPRFMTCNGYPQMPHTAPFNKDDFDRNEGNAAHWLVEQVHSGKFQLGELVDRKAFNGVFITEEMVEHVTPYLDAIVGRGQVECDTSYSDGQRYKINGRADHIFHDDRADVRTLHVSDFKYGWGIVEPDNNWTLISHALGWIFKNIDKHPYIAHIVFTIYQPRPHHPVGKIRSVKYNWSTLLDYYWQNLQAKLSNPTNELRTSAHCKDCPALASCPAAAKAGMNAIDVSELAFISEMGDAELGYMLDNIERAIKMLEQSKKAYSEKALHRIKAGALIPGYGRETDLTNKQWKDNITVDMLHMLTGLDLSKKQLMTPTQAVKAGLSEAIADRFCERREKGSKLVRIDANAAVKKLFGNAI